MDCQASPLCMAGGVETLCEDEIDNDNDDLTDCDDPDCAVQPVCFEPGFEALCDDEIDNDNDDLVDCDDPDCAITPICMGMGSEICDDDMDNDGDDLVDCDDDDCALDVNCLGGGGTEFTCSDTLDDDNDGKVDCKDSDCSEAPQCLEVPNCGNGTCDAADAETTGNCPEDCDNGMTGTCVGFCGGSSDSPDGCWCDDACAGTGFDDCCPDFKPVCIDLP